MKNPSLREEPREQCAPIMTSNQEASILGWLEGSGRLMDREPNDQANLPDDEDEEINALMSDGAPDVDDPDDDE